MIVEEHWNLHKKMAEFCHDPLLMLGNQECVLKSNIFTAKQAFAELGIKEYTTLDPDGGDVSLDLNDDLGELSGKYGTVFNLGTLEHIWDIHTAYCNALRAVSLNGTFVNVAPIQGWENHGIHVTGGLSIIAMMQLNGFEVIASFVYRNTRGVQLWSAAKKQEHIENLKDFCKPQQQYVNGKKEAVA